MANPKQTMDMLDGGLITFMQGGQVRLYEFLVKCAPGGVLMILKGVSTEGYMVAFVGAATVSAAVVKVLRQVREKNLRWKKDSFKATPLANLEE